MMRQAVTTLRPVISDRDVADARARAQDVYVPFGWLASAETEERHFVTLAECEAEGFDPARWGYVLLYRKAGA